MLIDVQYFECRRSRFIIDGVVDVSIDDEQLVARDNDGELIIKDPIENILKVSIVNLNGDDRVLYEKEKEIEFWFVEE